MAYRLHKMRNPTSDLVQAQLLYEFGGFGVVAPCHSNMLEVCKVGHLDNRGKKHGLYLEIYDPNECDYTTQLSQHDLAQTRRVEYWIHGKQHGEQLNWSCNGERKKSIFYLDGKPMTKKEWSEIFGGSN